MLFNESLNKKNTILQDVKDGEDVFLTLKISDLDTTIKVGLKSSFDVVDEAESISVSSETAVFFLRICLQEEQFRLTDEFHSTINKPMILYIFHPLC